MGSYLEGPGAGAELPDLAMCQALLDRSTLTQAKRDRLVADAVTRVMTRAICLQEEDRLAHLTVSGFVGEPGVVMLSTWPDPLPVTPGQLLGMRAIRSAGYGR